MQLECRDVPAYTGVGTGLVANYFTDPDLSDLGASRTDALVGFNWANAPAAGVPADGFSARWTGKVQAQHTETYNFSVAADEGVRLWVGGRLLINTWGTATPGEWSGTTALKAGELYDVKLEYADRVGGPAAVTLTWASPSSPKAVIPATQLYGSGAWLGRDLGAPASAGSLTSSGGTLTVRGAGPLGGTADQGHFASQPVTGDGTLTARLDSVAGGEAGLMIRAGSEAGAPFAAVTATGSGLVFRTRTAAGIAATQVNLPGGAAGTWLKLVRNGTLVSGYSSATGADETWQHLGTATVPLARSALTGLVASSADPSRPAAAALSGVSVAATIPVGANLDAVNDWSLANAFVDVMKQAREFKSLRTGQKAATGANGWPTEDFETFVQSGFLNTARVYNGTYKLSFTGRADVSLSVTPGRLDNLRYDPATNKTTADVTLNASDADGGWYFVLQFRNVGGGVKDVKLTRPGYDHNTTQVFTNQFLEVVEGFTTLRFMDFGRTNNNPVVNWSERSLPTDATQATDRGAAWEYMVQLANQTGKDLWVCVPYGATDDYVRNLATLLKNTLNPDRAVYLEWSNEVWNGMFSQTNANWQAAVAEVVAGMSSGSPSNLFYPGETAKNPDGTWASQWDWAFRRTAREIVEISNTFKSVWGADAINGRVRPVVGTQSAVPYILKTQLEYVDKVFGDPRNFLYGVAGAPYFFVGPADHQRNDLTVDDILNGLRAGIAEGNGPLNQISHLATYYGLAHLAYEGGPDTFGGNNIAAKKAASLDPRMKGIVAEYLNDWYQRGGGLFNWFVAGPTNYDTPYGTWGVTNDITNLDAPKAQGIDQVREAPLVLPAIGGPITGEVLARDYVAGANPTGDPYPRYLNTGDYRDYLVRAPQAGTYSLVIRYAQVDPGGRLEVLVNDRPVQTLTLPATGPGYDAQWAPNTFADTAPITVTLNEGLNVVRLRVVNKGYTLYSLKFGAPTETPPPPPPVPGNQAPAVGASAASATVTGTTVGLTAVGSDDGGEANLTYTWSVVSAPAGGSATFSSGGTNAAMLSTATFTRGGAYTLRVTATDAAGLTATATVGVTVVPTLAGLAVAPGSATVPAGGTRAFVAAGSDQFGHALAVPGVAWSAAGGGWIDPAGMFTAPGQAAAVTVTASVGGLTATAAVTVTPPSSGEPTVDYAAGFTRAGLSVNGAADVTDSRLRLTAGQRQAGTAFTTSRIDATRFATRFRFQMSSLDGSPWSLGDGMTFALQNQGATAVGMSGSGLGYAGIGRSLAVKFDVLGNSVRLVSGGVVSAGNSSALTGDGIDLRSGHVFEAALTYDGKTLTVTLTDTATGKTATRRYNVNVAQVLGGTTAHVGFTAGTGILAGRLDVLNWTYGNS